MLLQLKKDFVFAVKMPVKGVFKNEVVNEDRQIETTQSIHIGERYQPDGFQKISTAQIADHAMDVMKTDLIMRYDHATTFRQVHHHPLGPACAAMGIRRDRLFLFDQG